MSIETQYDVFVSHSSKDEKWVTEFAQYLTNWGLSVFIFEKAIRVGESIPRKINKVLEDCPCVILVMTQDWVDSEWSTHEAYSTLFDDPLNKKQKVVPILLDNCKVPITLKNLKYLNFKDRDKFFETLGLLKIELSDLIQINFNKQIYSLQCDQILNQSILPWTLHGGPSVGFIIPELFIEPKISAIKNPLSSIGIDNWLLKYQWDKNIAIVGAPGIGKSTLLKKIFIEYGRFQTNFNLDYAPIFITVRDLIEFKSLDFVAFSDYIFSKLDLVPFYHPNQRFLYFIDGLDEIEESLSEDIISIIRSITSKKDLFWITSRKGFFFTRIKINSIFYSLFYDVLEIQEWNIEKDSLKFAKDYSIKSNDTELYNRLLGLRENSPNINNFLKNPFELALILYILSTKEEPSTNAFDSSYTLYKSFYENWLDREQFRGSSKLRIDKVRNLHRSIALMLFNNKGSGISLFSLSLDKLDIDDDFANIKNDTSFWDLLITSNNKKETIIERFWHETLGEFILAEELIQSFCSSESFLKNLNTIYNHEVNLFIREGFQQLNNYQKNQVYERLAAAYFTEFSPHVNLEFETINESIVESLVIDGSKINNKTESLRVREQIIYYLGRLELNFYPPILSFAAKFEINLLLKRSAVLGGILYKNEELEKNYIKSLVNGSAEDRINRSVQLVYFGDAPGDIHSFKDNNVFSWEKTRNAILNRLRYNSKRDIALRWWDLRTLYCFFASRNWRDKILENDFNLIEQCIANSKLYSNERNKEVAIEVSRLLESLKKNNCIY